MRDIDTEELVRLAWEALPPAHRSLLTQVGASQWEIVKTGLGYAAEERLMSAGQKPPTKVRIVADNEALGMWVPGLRLVLINEMHSALLSADLATREALLTWVAWHEWGHALSVTNPFAARSGRGSETAGLGPGGNP